MPRLAKRNDERRRTNADGQNRVAYASGAVPVPPAGRGWHPVARRWYASLRESGQSAFYEPSDWAMAHVVAEAMSRLFSDGMTATLLAEVMRGMDMLLTSETARRRARVEVQRDIAEARKRAKNVHDIGGYRELIG